YGRWVREIVAYHYSTPVNQHLTRMLPYSEPCDRWLLGAHAIGSRGEPPCGHSTATPLSYGTPTARRQPGAPAP
ncbi:hypothetical protein PUR59_00720, partial [Streptomyces sp. SP18ES09]|nr:hypothetical protein [Streptomyces sp. SP18ES09]